MSIPTHFNNVKLSDESANNVEHSVQKTLQEQNNILLQNLLEVEKFHLQSGNITPLICHSVPFVNEDLMHQKSNSMIEVSNIIATANNFIAYSNDRLNKAVFNLFAINHQVNNLKGEVKRLREKMNENQIHHTSTALSDLESQERGVGPLIISSLNDVNLDDPRYEYKISLKQQIPEKLLKGRNFSFKIELLDENNSKVNVQEFQNIRFELKLFDSSSNAELIEFNKYGRPILIGKTSCGFDNNGEVSFKKIKITEVSSHFPNNIIQLLIKPTLSNDSENDLNEYLFLSKIKPFILPRLHVRAKFLKKYDSKEEIFHEDAKIEENSSLKKLKEM